MNSRTLRSTVLLSGAALACFGFLTAARAESSVAFTGGYSTIFSNSDGDAGTGSYSANTNGKFSFSDITCDDYRGKIATNKNWDGCAYQVSGFTANNLGGTLFDNTIGTSGYAEVATLGSMMFGNISSFGAPSGITQHDFDSAIWDVTTPSGIHRPSANASSLAAAVETSFSGNLNGAQPSLGSLSNLWILTPSRHPGFGLAPRELHIRHLNVSEGGDPLLYILLAALSCFGALFVSRRKSKTAQ